MSQQKTIGNLFRFVRLKLARKQTAKETAMMSKATDKFGGPLENSMYEVQGHSSHVTVTMNSDWRSGSGRILALSRT